MSDNDARTVACDYLVRGSEALLAGLGALTALGVLLAAIA